MYVTLWAMTGYPNVVRVVYLVSPVPRSVVRLMFLKTNRVWFVG
jgi:hypothetical protein